MKLLLAYYKEHFTRRDFLLSVFFAVILLCISLFFNFQAGVFATEQASNRVDDLILDAIPAMNVDFWFTWGGIALGGLIGMLSLVYISRLPFTLKAISIFVIVRSICISLTHMSPHAVPDLNTIMSYFTFSGDLFFSGHTGLPFLMALIYWDKYNLRVIFIAVSIFFGIIVLLGHFHYSIDVFAAPFMTYGIFVITQNIFKKDFKSIRI